MRCFSNLRWVRLKRSQPIDFYQALLPKLQHHRIYTTIGHELFLSPAERKAVERGEISLAPFHTQQQILVDGEPYIDEFGLYVYIKSRIGRSPDIDLRYENEPDPELFSLQHVEHDQFDWTSNPASSLLPTGTLGRF